MTLYKVIEGDSVFWEYLLSNSVFILCSFFLLLLKTLLFFSELLCFHTYWAITKIGQDIENNEDGHHEKKIPISTTICEAAEKDRMTRIANNYGCVWWTTTLYLKNSSQEKGKWSNGAKVSCSQNNAFKNNAKSHKEKEEEEHQFPRNRLRISNKAPKITTNAN